MNSKDSYLTEKKRPQWKLLQTVVWVNANASLAKNIGGLLINQLSGQDVIR